MRGWPLGRRCPAASSPVLLGVGSVGMLAAGQTDLQQVSPLVWVLLALTVAGALITFAFLAYALWKHRDPATRRRRYG